MSENIDSKSIILWGQDGAMGGHVKIHPRGSFDATIAEVHLTYIGLQNTEFWLGRARHQIEELFQSEFDCVKAELDTTDSKGDKL